MVVQLALFGKVGVVELAQRLVQSDGPRPYQIRKLKKYTEYQIAIKNLKFLSFFAIMSSNNQWLSEKSPFG